MAITKVITFTNGDGVNYTSVEDWLAAYAPPQINEDAGEEFPEGYTWVYALATPTSVTRTMTFVDQAAYDAWNGDGVTAAGTPWTAETVVKTSAAE
jgi:hypothetical protein